MMENHLNSESKRLRHNEVQRQYCLRHPEYREKQKESIAKFKAAHPDYSRNNARQWREDHPNEKYEQVKRYRKRHPEGNEKDERMRSGLEQFYGFTVFPIRYKANTKEEKEKAKAEMREILKW